MQQYPLRSRAGSYSDIFVAVGQIVTAHVRQKIAESHHRRQHLTLFGTSSRGPRKISQTDYFSGAARGERYAGTCLCGINCWRSSGSLGGVCYASLSIAMWRIGIWEGSSVTGQNDCPETPHTTKIRPNAIQTCPIRPPRAAVSHTRSGTWQLSLSCLMFTGRFATSDR